MLGAAPGGAEPPGGASVAEDGPRHREPLILATDGTTPPTFREEHPRPRHDHRHGHDGAALGVAFGRAFVEDVEPGWYGRFDSAGYVITTRRRGTIFGAMLGLEGWGARGDGDETNVGGGLPMSLFGGIQSDALFFVMGGGFHFLLVDRVDGDTGVGFFAPHGLANLGFDLEGVRFLVDGRAGYRWQLGADDRAAFMLGGAFQITTD